MTGRVFINYRRSDSQAAAGRLYDRLLHHFAREDIFMDVDGIAPGVDFVKSLDEQVAACGAFIAVIGPGWVEAKDANGVRRLDNPGDYVRVEIESALKRDIRVVPILVDGASMPRAEELPEPLRPPVRRNAVEITHVRFGSDVDDLAAHVRQALGLEPASAMGGLGFVPQYQAPRKLSWIEFLFSFDGRISRKQYLSGALLVSLFMMVIIYSIIGLVFWAMTGGNDEAMLKIAQQMGQGSAPPQIKWASVVAQLPFMWPMWALMMKRLHDFGQGWGLMLPIMLFGIVGTGIFLAGFDKEAFYLVTANVAVGVLIMLIKGTTGPNEYGPDPLAVKRTETAQT